MVKEVEIKKLNGKTQYVDWETGQELFKESDCIPIKLIEDWRADIDKKLSKEESMDSSEAVKLIEELDFYSMLLDKVKS